MTDQQLGYALELHQAGRLGEAEYLYRQILADEPDHVDALHLLGMVVLQAGDAAGAVELIRRAIALSPDYADYHNNLATALFHQSDHTGAEHECREALRLRPEFWQAHNNLGNALLAQQQFKAALAAYEAAIQLYPEYAMAMANAAHACRKLGDTARAIELCTAALAIDAESFEAWNNLGDALMIEERFDEAAQAFEQARQRRPDSAEIIDNLGNALRYLERWSDAIACHQRAIELRPDFAAAYQHLRAACRDWGNLDGAFEIFQQAAVRHPQSPAAHFYFANTCRDLHLLDEAEAAYRRALELQPDFAAAMTNLAITLSDQGRAEEALQSFAAAHESDPDDPAMHSHLLVCRQYVPGDTPATLKTAHQEWERRFSHSGHSARDDATGAQEDDAKKGRDSFAERMATKPLRVGFVSRDFRRHPVAFFLAGCLEHLDDQQIQSVCFADQQHEDEWTERIRAASDQWHDVADDSDAELAARIATEEIDLLIDLAGHTAGNRLLTFARRPAAVQATWLGYVGTTGLRAIDFLITDRFHTPAGVEESYCEKLLRLPDGYACYTPPAVAPAIQDPPSTKNTAPTFGCFNNPAKISDPTLQLWARILKAVPGSQLFLKYDGWQSAVARRVLLERCGAAGIEPHRLRIEGPSPHADLFARYSDVDVALDTTPYSGGITTCEALWMGVPVVTLPGATFASRHALSHLCNAGLPELVADNEDDYVRLATRLASDTSRLREYRHHLRQQIAASALCDASRFARNLTATLRSMLSNQ